MIIRDDLNDRPEVKEIIKLNNKFYKMVFLIIPGIITFLTLCSLMVVYIIDNINKFIFYDFCLYIIDIILLFVPMLFLPFFVLYFFKALGKCYVAEVYPVKLNFVRGYESRDIITLLENDGTKLSISSESIYRKLEKKSSEYMYNEG